MPLIGLSRHIVVGDTDQEAQAVAKRAFVLWYDALIHLWRAHGVGLPRQLIPEKFEDALDQGYIIAGSAATVRERMKRDNAIAGINYCMCRLAFGDLSFDESKRSVELFAKEVMPEFQEAHPQLLQWKQQVLNREIDLEEIDTSAFTDRYGGTMKNISPTADRRVQAAE